MLIHLYSNQEHRVFTATCFNSQYLLQADEREDVLMDSLRFMVNDKRIWLYGFVIMPKPIHFLWRRQEAWVNKSTEQMFLKSQYSKSSSCLLSRHRQNWNNTEAPKVTASIT
ncbi:MAG: hypothetical protein ACK5V5_02830 [Cyclobacteriaceae bacterium]|jgi:putative transposase|nr:hypothetical protein [Flammeovirgaceae bacterium]